MARRAARNPSTAAHPGEAVDPIPDELRHRAPFLSGPVGPVYCVDLAVVPNAKRTEAIGLHDGALRLRIAAPPVDGAANEAVLRWLAQAIGASRQGVELTRGASSRRKRVRFTAEPARVLEWLRELDDAGVLEAN